jgi:FolB domain-containing protein
MATISLSNLVVEGKHGVDEQEKTIAQPFRIDLELTYDSIKAQQSDNIADAIDYAQLRKTIITTVQTTSFNLLERLAQHIADQLLRDQRIENLTLSIAKPAIFDSGVPAVTLTFTQPK